MSLTLYLSVHAGPYVSTNSEFGDGEYPIVYSYVYCYGYEKSFKDCSKNVYPSSYCSRSSVAGLRCFEGLLLYLQYIINTQIY